MRLPDDFLEKIEQDGFAVVSGVLTDDEIGVAIAAVQSSGATDGAAGAKWGSRRLLSACRAIARLAASAAVRRLVEPVLGAEAFAVRGLWFDKLPEANWKVAWHQDLAIAVCERHEAAGFSGWSVKDGVPHVQPPGDILARMLSVRLHLDESHAANGPLRVIPGSHRYGRLSAAEIERWSRERESFTCLAPCGGAIVFRPLLLHASSAAAEPGHRRVIQLEFAAEELPGGLKWHEQVGPEYRGAASLS